MAPHPPTSPPPPPALDAPPTGLPAPGPTTGSKVAFHLVGVLVLVIAIVVAYAVAFMIGFAATTCGADSSDPALVDALRRDLMLVVLALAAVPAGWAWLGRRGRMGWVPWALCSAAVLLAGAVAVLPIHDVGTFCF